MGRVLGLRKIMLQRGRAHVSAERTTVKASVKRPIPLLQRGRAHVSAESRFHCHGNRGVGGLQRGRAHVSAERDTNEQVGNGFGGFNGAALT